MHGRINQFVHLGRGRELRMLLQVSHHLLVLLLREFSPGVSLAKDFTSVPVPVPVSASSPSSPSPRPEDQPDDGEDEDDNEEEAEGEEEPPAIVGIAVVGRCDRTGSAQECKRHNERDDRNKQNGDQEPDEPVPPARVPVVVGVLRLLLTSCRRVRRWPF